ncbi:MAG: radical SAM protein [Candidatus Wallbacteria bacterium]|nr:radical SAM protein [Candidatus Wallbacteria bacterium]
MKKIKKIASALWEHYKKCDLCPRICGVNRLAGELGFCEAGTDLKIASMNLHFGEEPPISGTGGSGTVFFTNCTLRCVFCQNYPISQLASGKVYSSQEAAEKMLGLQKKGAHNLNLVTPTHMLPSILQALALAVSEGFTLPIVYNTSGWERKEIILMLEGIVTIFLPDMKYSDDALAARFSGCGDYVGPNRSAILEMQRQQPRLCLDDSCVAESGLLIRHLVLPGQVGNTIAILDWICKHLGRNTNVSLMSQYFPAYNAKSIPGLEQSLSAGEYERAVEHAEKLGMENIFIQAI